MLGERTGKDAVRRLRLIEGQVAGIQKMIRDRRYCMDIVNQISAVEMALHKVSAMVLRNHMETCVLSAFRSTDDSDVRRKVDELMRAYDGARLR
jgi:DNA-binding FrmR family transcriptional regulator